MGLIEQIRQLKTSGIKSRVDEKIREFENQKNYFSELCFCILTANFQAEKSIFIQDKLKNKFSTLSLRQLKQELKKSGHRFPNKRAEYIVEARKHKRELSNILKTNDKIKIREWLVKNIKGLGYKESSHFLRNIGCKNLGIIDFHILDLLEKHKIIQKPKTDLTAKKYLQIENRLSKIAEKLDLNLAELDIYLWYLETGKILK